MALPIPALKRWLENIAATAVPASSPRPVLHTSKSSPSSTSGPLRITVCLACLSPRQLHSPHHHPLSTRVLSIQLSDFAIQALASLLSYWPWSKELDRKMVLANLHPSVCSLLSYWPWANPWMQNGKYHFDSLSWWRRLMEHGWYLAVMVVMWEVVAVVAAV